MKNNKKLIIVIIIVASILLLGGITTFVLLLPNKNTNNTVEEPKNNTTLGEEDGYYELLQNQNEKIYEVKCNKSVCVSISSISFIGDLGGMSFNVTPNNAHGNESKKTGYISLNFNTGCAEKSVIAYYDFTKVEINENEVQLTCEEMVDADYYSISEPTDEEIQKYKETHKEAHDE